MRLLAVLLFSADNLSTCNGFALSNQPLFLGGRRSSTSTSNNRHVFLHSQTLAVQETELVNGEHPFEVLESLNAIVASDELLPAAPQLTYEKFRTMQDKRVVVTIRYSGESGLRPYFLTVAKKLKSTHPDIIVERRILPAVDAGGEAVFEILVDGKVVVGKGRARRQKVARVDMARARSVFVSMEEVDAAISRATRRRRPNTVYGEDGYQRNLASNSDLSEEESDVDMQ